MLKRMTFHAPEAGGSPQSGDPAVNDKGLPPAAEGGEEEKSYTLTQKALDERLRRQSKSTRDALLKELGLPGDADLSAIKTALKAQKEADEAKKSELQKYQERLEATEKRAAEAESKAAAKDRELFLEREIRKSGWSEDSDVLDVKLKAWCRDNDIEESKLDSKKMEKFWATMKEAKPHFFGGEAPPEKKVTTGGDSGAPGGKSNSNGKTLDVSKMTPAERRAYNIQKYGHPLF